MILLKGRILGNLITFFILWNYILSQLKKYNSQGHKLDREQVIDNIKNNRRYDWGTGQEENWRQSWNPENPIRRKRITLRSIMIKSFLLYLIAGTAIELFVYIVIMDI